MRALLVALFILPTWAANAVEPARFSVEQIPSPFALKSASFPKPAVVDEALTWFMRSCAPLTTDYWKDVKHATARLVMETTAPYRIDVYGWSREISLEIELPDRLSVIPDRYRASGHVLLYVIGAGRRPGIVAQTGVSQELCGMVAAPAGADVFKSVPELSIIDR